MKISTILDHIDSGHMALPEFQRGYVWNRDQVRGLFDSLYRRHKDTNARWTKKHGKNRFGYKNHIDVDAEHKLIRSIGEARAEVKIGCMDLTYSLMRYLQLTKRKVAALAIARKNEQSRGLGRGSAKRAPHPVDLVRQRTR